MKAPPCVVTEAQLAVSSVAVAPLSLDVFGLDLDVELFAVVALFLVSWFLCQICQPLKPMSATTTTTARMPTSPKPLLFKSLFFKVKLPLLGASNVSDLQCSQINRDDNLIGC